MQDTHNSPHSYRFYSDALSAASLIQADQVLPARFAASSQRLNCSSEHLADGIRARKAFGSLGLPAFFFFLVILTCVPILTFAYFGAYHINMRFAFIIFAFLPTMINAQVLDRAERVLKDAVAHEIARRAPVPQRGTVVFDAPGQGKAVGPGPWLLYARLGPFSYRDNLDDHQLGSVQFRVSGSITKPRLDKGFYLEIRKDF